MAQYTIARVSNKEPKSWSFIDKKTGSPIAMLTYKVMVDGEEETIDVNRKADGAKPVAGEVLDGTLEDTDFGKRFKATPKPFGGSNTSYTPRDDKAIQSQWAIGNAITLLLGTSPKMAEDMATIESTATDLFAMIDRVKNSKPASEEPEPTPPGDLKADGSFKLPEGF